MSNTDNYVQIMTDSLIMKKSVLEKIVILNEEQKDIVSASEFNDASFRENVEKKSLLIDDINRLDAGFDDLFKRVREEIESDKESYRSQIETMKSLIRDVTELAVKVEADEARNKSLVEKRFNQLRKDVQQVRNNTQKASIYYQNMNKLEMTPQFLDKKK